MNYLFPAAFALNTLAMTALLICFGLAGQSAMAADVGIVQGASLALFYALSANARSLILNQTKPLSAGAVMGSRLALILPVVSVTYWLSTAISSVNSCLVAILILRRCVEWLGEVHLSELERTGNREFAIKYLLLQSLLLATAIGWTLGNMPMPLLGLFLWAFLPLLLTFRYIYDTIPTCIVELKGTWKRIVPHFGSSAIIGISAYVFRLLLMLMLGKHAAGDLFAAFALGGVVGSVIVNALGPSIVFQERNNGTRSLPRLMWIAIISSVVIGIALVVVNIFDLSLMAWSGKSVFFWGAVGFSMLGGVFMLYAQLIRLRLLQGHEEVDLFGPDTIMNMLIIMMVPLLADIFGVSVLATLYLLSAFLALIFYWSYQQAERMNKYRSMHFQNNIRILIAAMLLLPLFFQISGGLFRDPSLTFNSGGQLRTLPIPLSVLACYGGIALLGGYRRASISLSLIFFTCVLMIVATVISSQGYDGDEQSKFTLLIQFILPIFGLVLGQVYENKYGSNSASMEKTFFYTMAIIVPWQLTCSWLLGINSKTLLPDMYLFSIYQYLEYVPVIFVSAFLVAFCRLWSMPGYKVGLQVLALLMGVYVAMSMSMLAIAMFVAGLLIFSLYRYRKHSDKTASFLLVAVVLVTWGYMQYEKEQISEKFTFFKTDNQSVQIESMGDILMVQSSKLAGKGEVPAAQRAKSEVDLTKPTKQVRNYEAPPNVVQRIHYWKYYTENIVSSPRVLLFGHRKQPDRSQYPSAHNYFLDFIYNFGVLALLPMLAAIAYILTMLYRSRRNIHESPGLLSLSMVVFFLFLVENSLKVGLRQPYPGIITFFLMGILISRLSEINQSGRL